MISEPKRYNYIFEVAIASSESSFLFIAFLNTNPIIGILKI